MLGDLSILEESGKYTYKYIVYMYHIKCTEKVTPSNVDNCVVRAPDRKTHSGQCLEVANVNVLMSDSWLTH